MPPFAWAVAGGPAVAATVRRAAIDGQYRMINGIGADGRGAARPVQPFVAPAVRPPMSCRSATEYSASAGIIATTT